MKTQLSVPVRNAFTLVEIMIVVAIIGLLAAIAIPNYIGARKASLKHDCEAHLRQIQGAKMTWTLEKKKSPSDVPGDADLFGEMLYIREKFVCPAGGTYILGRVDEKPACSVAGHKFVEHQW